MCTFEVAIILQITDTVADVGIYCSTYAAEFKDTNMQTIIISFDFA
jgi:hypothetical protein